MKETKKVVACYVRVSTVGQNEASQRAELKKWLVGNGQSSPSNRWYVDKGNSGDDLERPSFSALQAAVFAGDIGTIATYKLDRLCRSLRDGINTLATWCDKGIRVVATSQNLDFNGTLGKMLAAILFGLAEMEQETRRERQRAGIDAAKKEGRYLGRKPGTTKASPEKVLECRDRGLKAAEIAKLMGISRNTVFVYLRNLAKAPY